MTRKGFTLLEVMVSITIFALVGLAAVSIFTCCLTMWQKQAKDLTLVNQSNMLVRLIANEVRQASSLSASATEITLTFSGSPAVTYRKYETTENGSEIEILQRRLDSQSFEDIATNLNPGFYDSNDLFSYNAPLLDVNLALHDPLDPERIFQIQTSIRMRE